MRMQSVQHSAPLQVIEISRFRAAGLPPKYAADPVTGLVVGTPNQLLPLQCADRIARES